jgi:hypothetical protein
MLPPIEAPRRPCSLSLLSFPVWLRPGRAKHPFHLCQDGTPGKLRLAQSRLAGPTQRRDSLAQPLQLSSGQGEAGGAAFVWRRQLSRPAPPALGGLLFLVRHVFSLPAGLTSILNSSVLKIKKF